MQAEQRLRLRPMAREKAEWFSREISEAIAAGRDAGQAGIDLQDELHIYVEGLPEEDREPFLSLWTQECDALTNRFNQEAEVLEQKNMTEAAESSRSMLVFVAVVVLLVVFVFAAR